MLSEKKESVQTDAQNQTVPAVPLGSCSGIIGFITLRLQIQGFGSKLFSHTKILIMESNMLVTQWPSKQAASSGVVLWLQEHSQHMWQRLLPQSARAGLFSKHTQAQPWHLVVLFDNKGWWQCFPFSLLKVPQRSSSSSFQNNCMM